MCFLDLLAGLDKIVCEVPGVGQVVNPQVLFVIPLFRRSAWVTGLGMGGLSHVLK